MTRLFLLLATVASAACSSTVHEHRPYYPDPSRLVYGSAPARTPAPAQPPAAGPSESPRAPVAKVTHPKRDRCARPGKGNAKHCGTDARATPGKHLAKTPRHHVKKPKRVHPQEVAKDKPGNRS